MITEKEKQIITRYVDDRYYDQDKLIKYLNLHEIVDNEIFSHCMKPSNARKGFENWIDSEYGYEPIPVSAFVRRIPFYFYVPNKDEKRVGNLKYVLTGMLVNMTNEPDIETLYTSLEYMFYELRLSLDAIFNYTIEQSGKVSQNDIFMQWIHYLYLCSEYGIDDYTPDNFITRYNEMLEVAGLAPIVYEIEMLGNCQYYFRNGSKIEFEGKFPCDKDGNPVMKWIGLLVQNPKEIVCKQDRRHTRNLIVTLQPNTVIKALNIYNEDTDKDEYWYQIYAGPQTMQFNYEMIKHARKRLKYTQKEVANAIETSVRTYQKWESGATTPDGYFLLRLLNWLDIPDVQDVIQFIE